MKKLGIRLVKKSTVRNILKAEGLDPCPKQSGATWDEFLARQAASLWQRDLFTQRVLTVKGLNEVFALASLNVKTRRVVLSPATFHPDAAWVAQQAEVFVKQARADGLQVRYVQRDRDGNFAETFDATLRILRVRTIGSAPQAPNTQAFVERLICSIRRECLDHCVFFGVKHLDSVENSWLEYYHAERPHQGRENELLIRSMRTKKPETAAAVFSFRHIRCRKRLGGLLKHYERVAA